MLIKIKVDKQNIWFGKHKTLGAFIYDKNSQFGFGIFNIYIFVFKFNKFSKFAKKDLKKDLEKVNDKDIQEYKNQINKYLKEIKNRRITHCYNCKRDLNSKDNVKCKKCNWLICICKRCGCQFIKEEISI